MRPPSPPRYPRVPPSPLPPPAGIRGTRPARPGAPLSLPPLPKSLVLLILGGVLAPKRVPRAQLGFSIKEVVTGTTQIFKN